MRFLKRQLRGRGDPVSDQIDFYKSKIDAKKFSRIYRKYINADPYPGYSKYLDLDKWLRVGISHVKILNLQDAKKLSILDIGTGAGYFPFVARNAGHDVMTIDIPENDFYREMINLLEIPRIEHKIEAFQTLPDLGRRFDVVTAFAICFNNHATAGLWGKSEWQFFIEDLKDKVVKKNSILLLKFNPEPDGQYIGSEILSFFRTFNAEINRSLVRMRL